MRIVEKIKDKLDISIPEIINVFPAKNKEINSKH